MATRRTNLEINEVSLCKRGANQGSKVVLAKSETDSMTVEELEKQVADITAERDSLKAEIAKASKPEEKVDEKIEKLDPELRALVEKAQSDASAAREESKLIKEALAKAERASLEKSITDRMGLMKFVLAGDDEKAVMLKTVVDMTPEQRDAVFKSLEKAETIAAKGGAILLKENGDSRVSGPESAKVEIQKKAELYKTEHKVTIEKARTVVREMNPELAKREQAEDKEIK